MALRHYPGAWRILKCNFDTGFKAPEMVKVRPVITISRRRQDGADLCTVIAISSRAPDPVRDFHYLLPAEVMPKKIRENQLENWVKVDMIQTVAFSRLDLYPEGRDKDGKRIYRTGRIPEEHIAAICGKIEQRLALEH